MNFLLFFISSIFSGIFFIFYKINLGENVSLGGQNHFIPSSSISGNLFIESIIFLLIGIILFFYFSNFSFFRKNISERLDEEGEEGNFIEKKSFLERFNYTLFLKKYLYYIGFLFFYFSIYLIFKSFGISDFSYFILFLNIIIGILFFITSKAEIFRDFIKINTILFSLYYIILYIYLLFLSNGELILLDIINTIFILSFFIISFYSDSRILKRKESDSVLILYFFLYVFIILSYYLQTLFDFNRIDFLYIIIFSGFIFNIIIYFFLQKVRFLTNSKYMLRALSFLFLYIATVFGIFVLLYNYGGENYKNIAVGTILFYSGLFNYFVHQKFQNYISFFFSVFTIIFLIYFIVQKYCFYAELYFMKWELIITFFLSFSLIVYSYIYRLKYNFDYIFLHICAFLVNFLGIVYYFYYGEFRILDFGIILFLDSILIFLSYFKLKKIK